MFGYFRSAALTRAPQDSDVKEEPLNGRSTSGSSEKATTTLSSDPSNPTTTTTTATATATQKFLKDRADKKKKAGIRKRKLLLQNEADEMKIAKKIDETADIKEGIEERLKTIEGVDREIANLG